jgi:hypothetical protein
VKELSGWSRVDFSDAAPPRAAYVRLVLGSGHHTSLLFTQLFLSPAGDTGQTLLANGDFADGLTGWHWAPGKRTGGRAVSPRRHGDPRRGRRPRSLRLRAPVPHRLVVLVGRNIKRRRR